jgi:hypothetical protein
MKTLLQYLFALALVILGIALLCNPSQPAQTTSQLEVDPGSNSQVLDRPGSQPLMRLA